MLDVDDTTLTAWNYELYSNWDFNPVTNASFVGLTGSTFTGNMFPATPGMLHLVDRAKDLGYAVFWITGRGDSQHAATIANLVDDSAAGFADIGTVTLSGKTVPESAYIESQGYEVVADLGDQFSDLLGGHADKTFRCRPRTTTSRRRGPKEANRNTAAPFATHLQRSGWFLARS